MREPNVKSANHAQFFLSLLKNSAKATANKNTTLSLLIIMALLCAGCVSSSQPADFYRLQPLAANAGETASQLALGVGRITLAEYLNRPQLQQNNGDFELHRSHQHRWAEPLESNIQRVVLENLSRITGSDQVQSFPFRADNRPQWVLHANVLALDIITDKRAELRVDWQWQETVSGRYVKGQVSRFVQSAESGPAAQAEAYSQLLLRWSQAAADQITALNSL